MRSVLLIVQLFCELDSTWLRLAPPAVVADFKPETSPVKRSSWLLGIGTILQKFQVFSAGFESWLFGKFSWDCFCKSRTTLVGQSFKSTPGFFTSFQLVISNFIMHSSCSCKRVHTYLCIHIWSVIHRFVYYMQLYMGICIMIHILSSYHM